MRPSTAARADLGRFFWEIAHLGSCHLEKNPWEVATWENAFWKVPNILMRIA